MKFLYPLNLLFLAALSVPVIIHLFSKKEMKTQDFPSLLFIIPKRSPRFYWLRIREIILLFVRLLVLTACVFAFSGMLTHSRHFSQSYQKVLIDNSLSAKGRITLKKGYIKTNTKGGVCKLGNVFQDNIPTLFITDLQKANFTSFLGKKRHFSNVILKDIGMPPNTGITGVKTGPTVAGKEANIYVKILNKNKGKQITNIRIYIDKKLVFTDIIYLNEGENNLSFPFTPQQGLHYGKIEIDRDKIPFDNIRYFTYCGIPSMSIAVISNKEPSALESALTTLGFKPYWTTEFTTDASLIIVIKKDIKEIMPLRHWKKVIISIPDTINKSSYSSELGLSISNKIPVKSKIITITDGHFLYPLNNYLKDIYFLPSFTIENYGEVELKSGVPLLLKQDKNTVVFNGSFLNNPFIYRPIFIPFLYYTIKEMYSPHQEDKIIDDKIVIKTQKRTEFFIVNPKGKRIPFQEEKGINGYRYNFILTKKQGIYKIFKKKVLFDLIAFNSAPVESNTETLDIKEKKLIFSEKNYADISLLFLLTLIILIGIETFIERR